MDIKIFNQHIEDLISKLENPTIAKTLRTLDLLGEFGKKLGMPHSKKINNHLFELRIRGKKEIRIIYCFHKEIIILLHAFIKKTNRIPKKHIIIANKRLNSLDN